MKSNTPAKSLPEHGGKSGSIDSKYSVLAIDRSEGRRHSVMAMLMADGDRFGGVCLQLRFDHEEGRSDSAAYTTAERRGSRQFDERRFSILILKHSVVFER